MKAVLKFRSFSDVSECCKGLGKEWISIVGVVDTQRCHSDTSWAQYVAAVMGSFVKKVLQNDQVFAILGGEALAPREHSPLLCSPLQETVSLKGEIAQSTLFNFMLRKWTYPHGNSAFIYN